MTDLELRGMVHRCEKPPDPDPEERAKAVHFVAAHALDAEDLAWLLDVLGLDVKEAR